jgi:8-amino-7-oxononanoate synthase
MEYIKKILKAVDRFHLYPHIRTVSSAADPEVVVDGKNVLSFCSNNYLGMATHPRVIKASMDATKKYGTSCGGSRLISGNLDIQEELEKETAAFKSAEAAITFMTGFMANTGIIPSLMNVVKMHGLPSIKQEDNAVISDELNHASIVDGCRLAKAQRFVYKHRNLIDLERILIENRKKRKLIVTDGVFSMDGDIAPLPQIVKLARKYKAILMVDDAHATGLLGKNGGGTVDYFNLKGKVDVVMGTFSKAFGGVGGFVVGSKDLIKFLRVRARQYIFSSALPPGTTAGLIAAIRELKSNSRRKEILWGNVRLLKGGLKRLGFNTLESETQIIPVFIGKEKKAIQASEQLFKNGIFVPCVRWPAVPEGLARLRCTVMASHTEKQISQALNAFEKVGKSLKII